MRVWQWKPSLIKNLTMFLKFVSSDSNNRVNIFVREKNCNLSWWVRKSHNKQRRKGETHWENERDWGRGERNIKGVEERVLCPELLRGLSGPLIFAALLLPRSIDTSYYYTDRSHKTLCQNSRRTANSRLLAIVPDITQPYAHPRRWKLTQEKLDKHSRVEYYSLLLKNATPIREDVSV